jgi:hypothetical protein
MRYNEIIKPNVVESTDPSVNQLFTEATNEAEQLPYEVIDQMRELRAAIEQIWKYTPEKRILPATVQAQVLDIFANQNVGRGPLYRALDQLWKYCDKYELPRQIQSQAHTLLSSLGHLK